MPESKHTPSEGAVMRAYVDAGIARLHTAIPAKVTRYDATTQRVDAKPLVKRAYYDELGERQVESLPVVPGVPVVFPGAGSYSITFPIAAGDVVLLIFSERSLDKWLSEGGEVDPLDDRRHNMSDGIAIPGLRPFADPIEPAPPTDALVVTGGEIRLGSEAASDPPALSSELADLKTRIAAWAPVPNDGGNSLKAVFSAWPVPGAAKVKVE